MLDRCRARTPGGIASCILAISRSDISRILDCGPWFTQGVHNSRCHIFRFKVRACSRSLAFRAFSYSARIPIPVIRSIGRFTLRSDQNGAVRHHARMTVGARSGAKLRRSFLANHVLYEGADVVFAEQVPRTGDNIGFSAGKIRTEIDRIMEKPGRRRGPNPAPS